jgi:hypothetical protein
MAVKKTTTKSTPAKKSSSVGISILGGNKADMRKWEIESAMSTLQRASEIQKNAKLMNDVKKMAAGSMKKQKSLIVLLLVKRFNHGKDSSLDKI